MQKCWSCRSTTGGGCAYFMPGGSSITLGTSFLRVCWGRHPVSATRSLWARLPDATYAITRNDGSCWPPTSPKATDGAYAPCATKTSILGAVCTWPTAQRHNKRGPTSTTLFAANAYSAPASHTNRLRLSLKMGWQKLMSCKLGLVKSLVI